MTMDDLRSQETVAGPAVASGDGAGNPTAIDTGLAPGTILLNSFQILDKLGSGGMGDVFRARHLVQGTQHAIKVLRADMAQSRAAADLFKREAALLRHVRHESVVQYDGTFQDDRGRIYLVMELVEGALLADMLRAGPLAPEAVRRLRTRIASGLASAHERGVVHRDLSPDNIVLPGGDPELAKIIDFGIAKVADPSAGTIVDGFVGKMAFASPEQFGLQGGSVGPPADIYSFGLVLAACAHGAALPMGETLAEALRLRESVPTLPPGIASDLRDEIARMLQPEPGLRPTAKSLVGSMQSSTIIDAVLPRADVESAPAPVAARRSRLASQLAAGAVGVALALAGLARFQPSLLPERLREPLGVAETDVAPSAPAVAAVAPVTAPAAPAAAPPVPAAPAPAAAAMVARQAPPVVAPPPVAGGAATMPVDPSAGVQVAEHVARDRPRPPRRPSVPAADEERPAASSWGFRHGGSVKTN